MSKDDKYVIVEWQTGGVSIVCSNWITPMKKEVYWPPFKDQTKFDRALKNCEPAEEKSWALHSIARCMYASDSFEKVRLKWKEAEETSNLDSDGERFERKRKVVRRKYFDSEDSDDEQPTKYLKPPKPRLEIPSSNLCSIPGTSKSCTVFSQTSGLEHSSKLSTQSVEVDRSIDSNTGQKILAQLVLIKEQNKQILELLNKNPQSTLQAVSSQPVFPVQLPLNSNEDLRTLEQFLTDVNNKKASINYFASLGGSGINNITNRVLKRILGEEVASKFNFFGKRNKLAFLNLNLKSVVVGAVQQNSPEFKERDIEDCIKIWLKHSPQRLLVSQKRNTNIL